MTEQRLERRTSLVIIGQILIAALCAGIVTPAIASALPPMHRGFNTFPWLYRTPHVADDPERFDVSQPWPYLQRFTSQQFETLHRLGADFIRVPVEPSVFLAGTEAQRDQLVESVVRAIGTVTATGMTAIVDFHPRETRPAYRTTDILQSTDLMAAYEAMAVDFAKALAAQGGGKVVLELMNEPPGNWSVWGWRDNYHWLERQVDLVKAVRAVAPTLPLIVEGDRGGGIDGLLRVDPSGFDDPAIIYSFHYYEPMVVTHQGANWDTTTFRAYLAGVPYPADPSSEQRIIASVRDRVFADSKAADKEKLVSQAKERLQAYDGKPQSAAAIARDFARVTVWAKSHAIPPERIILGEFGVLRPGGSLDTAVNYLRDVRTAAEQAGFAWSVWNYMPFDEGTQGFSMLRMTAPMPDGLEPRIIHEGLGLAEP